VAQGVPAQSVSSSAFFPVSFSTMGCSGSKSSAVPAAGKEEITGAADAPVAAETQPQDAEKQAAQAAPVAEVKTEEPGAEDSTAEQPKAEEPQADEPKAEMPNTAEPKNEEPKAEESKRGEPKAEESKNEEPKVEEPKNDEPKSDEPKAEELTVETVKVEEPKVDDAKTDVPAEQAVFRESELDIKVTSADVPQSVCTCSLW